MDGPEKPKNLSWRGELITGWLGFFIFTLLIVNPIFNAFLVIGDSVLFTDYVEGIAGITLFILAGFFLLKRKPYAVKFAKVFLLVTFITNITFMLLGWDDIGFIGVPYFIIWFWYLNVSKQVKGIFGPLKEQQKGTQIWPKLAIIYSFFSPIFGFVFSIIALWNISKNRKLKGLWMAVGGLLISITVFFGLFIYGFIYYAGSYYEYEVPSDIETKCNDYCYELQSYKYTPFYNTVTENYGCYCFDEYNNTLEYIEWPSSESSGKAL